MIKIKHKKQWRLLGKVLILILSLLFVYNRLIDAPDIHNALGLFSKFWSNNYIYIILTILLIPVNWGIEAFKWKFVIGSMVSLNFREAFKSVVSGVTIGMYTPNRVGEFGGRILYLPKGYRTVGALKSMVASFTQFIVTMVCGWICFSVFLLFYSSPNLSETFFSSYTIWIMTLLSLVLLFLLINIRKVWRFLSRFKFIQNRYHQFQQSKVSFTEIWILLALSFIRYLVFITQFYLVTLFCDLSLSYWQVFFASSNLYLLMALLPMFTIGEPGLRAALTVAFFSPFTTMISVITLGSLLLWFFNVFFIALVGSVFILSKSKTSR